jgi:hypothetical protein
MQGVLLGCADGRGRCHGCLSRCSLLQWQACSAHSVLGALQVEVAALILPLVLQRALGGLVDMVADRGNEAASCRTGGHPEMAAGLRDKAATAGGLRWLPYLAVGAILLKGAGGSLLPHLAARV